MNTTTMNHPVNGHHLACEVDRSNNNQIISALVYADEAHKEFIGLVQLGRADGSEWLISLGEGWIVGVTPTDIYDAIDVIAKMRVELDATKARLQRLWAAATTPELRADVRGLIRDLAGGRMADPAIRLAAATIQYDLY